MKIIKYNYAMGIAGSPVDAMNELTKDVKYLMEEEDVRWQPFGPVSFYQDTDNSSDSYGDVTVVQLMVMFDE